jgi:hypothetical protein
MSWRDIINKGFQNKVEEERRKKEEEEEERERERQKAESLRIARTLVLRVRPVFQEFATMKGWGWVEERENELSGDVWLKCDGPEVSAIIDSSKIMVCFFYSSTHNERGPTKGMSTHVKMPVEEFTEEAFAEALVKAFLK